MSISNTNSTQLNSELINSELNLKRHIPVLVNNIVNICENSEMHIDCNLGDGGHVQAISQKNKKVIIHAIDADQKAIDRSLYFLPEDVKKRLHIYKGNFENMKDLLPENLIGKVDTILFDLGISTYQIGKSERGFSFMYEEKLDMRFGESLITAYDIVNEWSVENISLILKTYGEENQAWRIAKKIEEVRNIKPIENSKELADIISSVVFKNKKSHIHPATKTFQALRIAVNNEIEIIEKACEQAYEFLNQNGKIIVISYHSLEDRIIKHLYKKWEKERGGKIETKKPIIPDKTEIEKKPKSRSAKMRIYTKI